MTIRREGLSYIALSAFVSAIFTRVRLGLGLLGWGATMFIAWFFRDPKREIPQEEGLILSPADGKVLRVEKTYEDRVGDCTKVSIFMSIFNVHINRAIVGGTVVEKYYRPGKFYMASLLEKTEKNERMILYIKNNKGIFRMDQVAGMVARRIICWPKVGDMLSPGQKIGLICFGSLLECYIPEAISIIVRKGDRVSAGQSILGRA